MFQHLKPSANSFMLYTVIARDRTHTIFTGPWNVNCYVEMFYRLVFVVKKHTWPNVRERHDSIYE